MEKNKIEKFKMNSEMTYKAIEGVHKNCSVVDNEIVKLMNVINQTPNVKEFFVQSGVNVNNIALFHKTKQVNDILLYKYSLFASNNVKGRSKKKKVELSKKDIGDIVTLMDLEIPKTVIAKKYKISPRTLNRYLEECEAVVSEYAIKNKKTLEDVKTEEIKGMFSSEEVFSINDVGSYESYTRLKDNIEKDVEKHYGNKVEFEKLDFGL